MATSSAALQFVCRSETDVLESVALLLGETPLPRCVCPVCRQPVILVRPRSRVHAPYARHAHGTTCASRTLESAAHEGTKALLMAAFAPLTPTAGPTPVYVRLQGPTPSPGGSPEHVFLLSWTETATEVSPPPTDLDLALPPRLDFALLRPESRQEPHRVALAIEVCDHHPVNGLKAAALAAARIPWIEIQAVTVAAPMAAPEGQTGQPPQGSPAASPSVIPLSTPPSTPLGTPRWGSRENPLVAIAWGGPGLPAPPPRPSVASNRRLRF